MFIDPGERGTNHKHMVDDTQSFESRFSAVLSALNLQTKAELAELVGVSPQGLNNWVNRSRRISSDARMKFQEATGISVDWLNDNFGEMWLPNAKDSSHVREGSANYLRPIRFWDDASDLPPEQYVMLPKLDYYLSAGCGGFDPNTAEHTENLSAFRADFAAAERWSAKTHYTMRAKGDSMEPTIQDGAPVVIATNEKSIKSGRIYAILIDGEPLLKRLDKLPGAMIRVRSDNAGNPAYSPFEVNEGSIEIIGRAVWTPVRL